MRPPFPWNGAKTRLIGQLDGYILAWGGRGRWVEPFLGSGVVARHVRDRFPQVPMIAGDLNPWLMAAHQYWFSGKVAPPTMNDVTPNQIQKYRAFSNKDFDNLSERDQALRFLVCLYSAWGNRWQTNPEGIFTTPINEARGGGDADFLLRRLQESYGKGWFLPTDKLISGGWKTIADEADPGDILFLDSPYPETAGYSVAWDMSDWSEMFLWVKDYAIPAGINVLVCNPGTLRLLWNTALPYFESAQVDSQGRSAVDRCEYIGCTLPTKQEAGVFSLFEELR